MPVTNYEVKMQQYGEALMKYRRGLINHQEMMALCDKAEQTYLQWLESNRTGTVEYDLASHQSIKV